MPEKEETTTQPTGTEGEETASTEPTGETKKIIVEHHFLDKRGEGEKPESKKGGETAPAKGEGEVTGETGGEKTTEGKGGEKPVTAPTTPAPTKSEKPAEKPTTEGEEGETVEELKTKLQERESQLAALALKEFEDEKTKLLAVIKDDKKKKFVGDFIGDDPEKLEQVKLMTGLLGQALAEGGAKVEGGEGTGTGTEEVGEGEGEGDGTETVPPKGKVKKPPKKSPNIDGRQIIDDLYSILSDPAKTKAEKDIAEKKINELFGQFVQGSKDAGKIVPIKVLSCPACGEVMEGNTCQHCSYIMPSWESKPPRGIL